jgi:hypothetical protein
MKAFKIHRNQQDYYRVDLPPRLFLDGKRRSVMAKSRREAIEKAEELIAKRRHARGRCGDSAQQPCVVGNPA